MTISCTWIIAIYAACSWGANGRSASYGRGLVRLYRELYGVVMYCIQRVVWCSYVLFYRELYGVVMFCFTESYMVKLCIVIQRVICMVKLCIVY